MKQISLLFVLLLSFSTLAQSIETKEFWMCTLQGAKGLRVRSLRVHQFKENNKCLGLYSRQGMDQVIAEGRWLMFCKKMLNQVKETLEKNLWDCGRFESNLFNYSEQKNVL